jgi:asparagine synthase (glutamine-hydrolysing)
LRDYAETKAGAVGSVPSPLVQGVKRPQGQAGVSSLSFGAPEGPPRLTSIFDDFTLRSPSCVLAMDDEGLVLARGPFGGRSLYYASNESAGEVVACSRFEPILAWLSPFPSVDVERLAELVAMRDSLDAASTPYRGISRVGSCFAIRFSVRGKSVVKRVPSWPALRRSDASLLANDLRSTLECVVERSSRPFSKIAVMAGGGVDSSGILAVLDACARRRGNLGVQPYAMDFAGPGDDRPHLRELAVYLGARPNRTRPAEAVGILPATLVVDGMPNVIPGMSLLMWIGRQARHQGAEATFTGFAGDDVLDGDLSSFAARARQGEAVLAFVDVARLRGPWRGSRLGRVRDLFFRRLLADALPGTWLSTWSRLRAKRRTMRSEQWSWAGPRLRVRLCERPETERKDYWSRLATFGALLDDADARGQQECETRLPRIDVYLDAEMVDFLASVPPKLFFHDHRVRGLYRSAMRGLLPNSLRLRTDKAEFEPANDELARAVCESPWFVKLLRMEALGDLGLVEPRRFREAFGKFKDHRADRSWLEFWPALAVEGFALGWGQRPAATGESGCDTLPKVEYSRN